MDSYLFVVDEKHCRELVCDPANECRGAVGCHIHQDTLGQEYGRQIPVYAAFVQFLFKLVQFSHISADHVVVRRMQVCTVELYVTICRKTSTLYIYIYKVTGKQISYSCKQSPENSISCLNNNNFICKAPYIRNNFHSEVDKIHCNTYIFKIFITS